LLKTDKLYLVDPYTVSFQATVTACERDGQGRLGVVLNRSYFYPESGGQSADYGTIGSDRVVDVTEGAGESVCHYIEPASSDADLQVGAEVACQVDWERRFDHMQQHTGQHVLSRAFIETGGLQTVSFHMGEQLCTIDLEGPGFNDEIVAAAEDLANRVVTENHPIEVRTVPVGELGGLDGVELRRAIPDDVSEVRLVEVKGFDRIPCCGTHVRTTGELGVIKILKSEKARGLERVYFAVGTRAFRDYREKHDIIQSLANRLTTSAADVASKMDKLIAEGQRARKERKRLSQALAGYEAQTLLERAREWKGTRIVTHFFSDRDEEYLQVVSATLKREPATVVIVGSHTGSVVCSASDDIGVEFARLAIEAAKEAGGSGGGKGTFARLKIPGNIDMREFLEGVTENVKREIE
jgi:alanyl-tRNA synthetase